MFSLLRRFRPPFRRFCSSERQQPPPDFYAILGLTKAADERQIKLAYFEKAKKYHPDSNPGDEARFMFTLVAEAYDVLSDERKRRDYDDFGISQTFGGMASGPETATSKENIDPEELFGKIFGEANDRDKREANNFTEYAQSKEGFDAGREYRLTLDFEQAARGIVVDYPLTLKVECPKCDGNKSELGFTWNTCPYCEGTGVETKKSGYVLTRHPCSYCNGTKQFHKYKCLECEGTGVQVLLFSQVIEIPPGSQDGQVLKYLIDPEMFQSCRDMDEAFYVYLRVKPSPHFKQEDRHIYSEADLSVAQSILGGSLFTKGLHKGFMEVSVPPLTGSHNTLTAYNEGIEYTDGTMSGHHFIKVGVQIPDELNPVMRDIWTRFARLEMESNPEAGTVEGVANPLGHKFEVNVVEADTVERKFGAQEEGDEEEASDEKEQSVMGKVLKHIFKQKA